jgi:hypothetical protein
VYVEEYSHQKVEGVMEGFPSLLDQQGVGVPPVAQGSKYFDNSMIGRRMWLIMPNLLSLTRLCEGGGGGGSGSGSDVTIDEFDGIFI